MRFDIPVYYSVLVSHYEGIGNLCPIPQSEVDWKLSPLDSLSQSLALQILHDQEVDPVFVADVIERANMRVVQGGDGASLTYQPSLLVRIRCYRVWKHLDGNSPVKTNIGGQVHLTHAAFAKLGGYFIRAEPSSGRKRHGLLWGSVR